MWWGCVERKSGAVCRLESWSEIESRRKDRCRSTCGARSGDDDPAVKRQVTGRGELVIPGTHYGPREVGTGRTRQIPFCCGKDSYADNPGGIQSHNKRVFGGSDRSQPRWDRHESLG